MELRRCKVTKSSSARNWAAPCTCGAGSGLLGFLAHLVGSNRGVARAAFVWRVMASFVGILLFELGVETVIDLEHWRVGRLVAFGAVSAAVAVVLYLSW